MMWPMRAPEEQAGLVCIAKNEGRFIVEWAAHYLALGFDRIVVYDHESTDGMSDTLDALARVAPVTRIAWSPPDSVSPQLSAYADALRRFRKKFEWLAFFDADEFLVFRSAEMNMRTFLSAFPQTVGAIGFNWLCFGSSGRIDRDYGLVRDAFRMGAERNWGTNKWVKLVVRPRAVRRIDVHFCKLWLGDYVTPSQAPLVIVDKNGKTHSVDHAVAQLHHYHVKSRSDYAEKIARGMVIKSKSDPNRILPDLERRFRHCDRNEVRYDDIDANRAAFERAYDALRQAPGVARTERASAA